jgi:hypothetical protein
MSICEGWEPKLAFDTFLYLASETEQELTTDQPPRSIQNIIVDLSQPVCRAAAKFGLCLSL